MIDIEELKNRLRESGCRIPIADVAYDAIESLQTELSRRDGTIGIISNALSHAEQDCAMYRSKAGELENENRRLKLDLEEATQAIQDLIDSHKRDTNGECDESCDIVAGMEAARDVLVARQQKG